MYVLPMKDQPLLYCCPKRAVSSNRAAAQAVRVPRLAPTVIKREKYYLPSHTDTASLFIIRPLVTGTAHPEHRQLTGIHSDSPKGSPHESKKWQSR